MRFSTPSNQLSKFSGRPERKQFPSPPLVRHDDVGLTIKALQAAGKTTLRAIADGLNEQGIPTARGQGEWTATQVQRVLERLG
jgi:Recombinase-like helix-turn-helix domain